jgi:hypothetical protein
VLPKLEMSKVTTSATHHHYRPQALYHWLDGQRRAESQKLVPRAERERRRTQGFTEVIVAKYAVMGAQFNPCTDYHAAQINQLGADLKN